MLKTISFSFILFIVLMVAAACRKSGSGGANSTASPGTSPPGVAVGTNSTKFVKATTSEAQIAAGGSSAVEVHISIQPGYHVNANPPTFSYLKATELSLDPGDGLSIGYITYPGAVTKKFSFADQPLAVYEGDATISATLKATPKATKGPRTLAAKLKVQACDDQVCYAPGTIDLSIPISVK